MQIGVVIESFREPLFQALETAASIGVKGVQMYADCKKLSASILKFIQALKASDVSGSRYMTSQTPQTSQT